MSCADITFDTHTMHVPMGGLFVQKMQLCDDKAFCIDCTFIGWANANKIVK